MVHIIDINKNRWKNLSAASKLPIKNRGLKTRARRFVLHSFGAGLRFHEIPISERAEFR